MGLLATITTPSGKRPLGWVVATTNDGNVLVVRRTPRAIAVTTKRSQYVSINESAHNEEAGWALEEKLIRAIKTHNCTKVVVYMPKPGMLYTTDANNYFKGGTMYMATKSKTGSRMRTVATKDFDRRQYRVKL